VIPPIQIVSIGVRVVGQCGVEVVDVIDLVTIVLVKRAPKLTIYGQMDN